MKLLHFLTGAPATTNRKILRATLIVGWVALLARIAGTFKELVIARSFGRGDEMDAFLIAFVAPVFVLNIGMSALGYALVPVLVETREREGGKAMQEIFSSVLFLSCVLLAGSALCLGSLAPAYIPVLARGFSPQKLALTRQLLYLLLPWIVLSGVGSLLVSVLNAGERFAAPALVTLTTPVLTTALVLWGAPRWGIFAVAAGTVGGGLLETALLLAFLYRSGIRFIPRWRGFDQRLRRVLQQYAPMLAGAILMGGTAVVDQAMAAMLPPGNVAALGYGNKIILGLLNVCALGLGTGSLPYLARMVAVQDWEGCRHTLKRYSMLIVAVSVPVALAVAAFSRPIIGLMFERGAFTGADTALVSRVQVFYAIQIPFYVWNMLFVRFISSVRRNDVLMYASGAALLLDVALNLVFMRTMGVAGIALSTSVVCVASFLIISAWSYRFLARRVTASMPAVLPETSQ